MIKNFKTFLVAACPGWGNKIIFIWTIRIVNETSGIYRFSNIKFYTVTQGFSPALLLIEYGLWNYFSKKLYK